MPNPVLAEGHPGQARQVIVRAQDEARSLKHHYISTEHILIGLLRDESTAAQVAIFASGTTLASPAAFSFVALGMRRLLSGQSDIAPPIVRCRNQKGMSSSAAAGSK